MVHGGTRPSPPRQFSSKVFADVGGLSLAVSLMSAERIIYLLVAIVLEKVSLSN